MGKKKKNRAGAPRREVRYLPASLHTRDEAVRTIANIYQEDKDYIVAGPMFRIGAILNTAATATCFMDAGLDTILMTSGSALEQSSALYDMAHAHPEMSGIILVPKDTPEAALRAGGVEPYEDDDIFLIDSADKQYCCYPSLLVDVIDIFDPISAAKVRAHSIDHEPEF